MPVGEVSTHIGEQEDPEIERCGAHLSAEQRAQLHQVMEENFSK